MSGLWVGEWSLLESKAWLSEPGRDGQAEAWEGYSDGGVWHSSFDEALEVGMDAGERMAFEAVLERLVMNDTTLDDLDLTGNEVGDGEAEELACAMQHNTSLTSLDLYGNNIGPAGARHLAAVLAKNTTLQTLHIGHNHIGEEGAQALAGALEHNSTLMNLHVCRDGLTRAGLLAIARTLQAVPWLRPPTLYDSDLTNAPVLAHLANELNLPPGAVKWTDAEIMGHFRAQHAARLLAFAMGAHGRLGGASLVASLNDECISMIGESFWRRS